MRAYRELLAFCLTATVLTATATAQPPAASPTATPATPENVLTRIPGDSLGFVAVGNVASAAGSLNKFIADAGLTPMIPGDVLAMLKTFLRVGEGFNDNGGLALVVLDAARFGWDLPGVFAGKVPPPEGPPPIAAILPGADPMSIFGAYQPRAADGYVVLSMGEEKTYAKTHGGYTVLAGTPEMLEAVVASPRSMAEVMPANHKAMVGRCDIAAYANLQRLAPTLTAAVDAAMETVAMLTQSERTPPGARNVLSIYGGFLPFYKNLIAQSEAATVGLRISKNGLVIDSLNSYLPDSPMHKILAVMAPASEPLLGKLPDHPYVLAAGGVWGAEGRRSPEMKAMTAEILESLLSSEFMTTKAPEATRDDIRRLAGIMGEQLTGAHFYAGGAPAGKGFFGLALVLNVNDSRVVMDAMPDLVRVKTDVLKALLAGMADVDALSVNYQKGAATANGATVDVIEIDCPAWANMDAADRTRAAQWLGEERLRVYAAAANPRTVAITFGGTETFCASVLAAAAGAGPLADDVNIAAAMKEVPQKRVYAGAFSLQNLVELVKTHVGKAGGDPDQAQARLRMLEMIQFQTQTPIAMGGAIEDAALHQSLFVPTPLINDLVRTAMMFMIQGMQYGPGGGPGE